MKITRTAYFRKEREKILFEDNPLEPIAWRYRPNVSIIGKTLVGKDRGNSYNYFVDFTPSELLSALETALDARTDTRAEKAIARSSLAVLRELLSTEPDSKKADK